MVTPVSVTTILRIDLLQRNEDCQCSVSFQHVRLNAAVHIGVQFSSRAVDKPLWEPMTTVARVAILYAKTNRLGSDIGYISHTVFTLYSQLYNRLGELYANEPSHASRDRCRCLVHLIRCRCVQTVLFYSLAVLDSRPRHGRNFSIYPCPLSF